MEQGLLDKKQLGEFLGELQKEYTVYGPVNGDDGAVLEKVESPDQVTLEYANFKLSPKGMFFPQCEVLATFDRDGVKEVPASEEKFVVFGIRPCDASAVGELDVLFGPESTGYSDPYYTAKRANGVVISLACIEPHHSCFCFSFEGQGPFSEKGSDIIVAELDKGLLFKACSDKGKELLEKCSSLFKEASSEEQEAREKLASAAQEKIEKIHTEGVSEKLTTDFFNSPVWNNMFSSCIGCGTCTYLCPTCHCFDVVDEPAGDKGKRVRAWDSCQFSLFTLHTSGHNPRPSKTERMRQRLMHKFAYTVKNFDQIFCVGCGRCVRSCPVNLDIREMVETIRAQE